MIARAGLGIVGLVDEGGFLLCEGICAAASRDYMNKQVIIQVWACFCTLTGNSVSWQAFLADCAGLSADECGCVCLAEGCSFSCLGVAGTLCGG